MSSHGVLCSTPQDIWWSLIQLFCSLHIGFPYSFISISFFTNSTIFSSQKVLWAAAILRQMKLLSYFSLSNSQFVPPHHFESLQFLHYLLLDHSETSTLPEREQSIDQCVIFKQATTLGLTKFYHVFTISTLLVSCQNTSGYNLFVRRLTM